MKKINNEILYLTYDGLRDPLGRSQIVPFVNYLAKNSYKITLVSFEKSFEDCKVKIDLNENIIWKKFKYHKKPILFSAVYDILTLILYIITLRKKFRIVHCRSYVFMIPGIFVKVLFKSKLIFDMRGYWFDERFDGKIWPKNKVIYKIVKVIEYIFVKFSDIIIVLTERMRKKLHNDYVLSKGKIFQIPTFVDLETYKILHNCENIAMNRNPWLYNRLKGKRVLVYSGSIGTVYKLKEMFNFFKVFNGYFGNAHFLIMTNGNIEMVNQLALDNNIQKKDYSSLFIDYKDIVFWLNLSHLGLAFYEISFSSIGRSPTKLTEYFACGLPIVVNKEVGDTEELINLRNIGIVVDDFTDKTFRKIMPQLNNLLSDNLTTYRCINTANELFSLKRSIESYKDIYSKCGV